MKTFKTVMMVAIAISFFMGCSTAYGYEPPKRMSWGMSHQDCKDTLKTFDQKLQLKKLKKIKHDSLHMKAEIKNLKLFKKKPKVQVLFDSVGLVEVRYEFKWDVDTEGGIFSKGGSALDKCWQMRGRAVKALTSKYGPPDVELKDDVYGKEIAMGVFLRTAWVDTSNNSSIEVLATYSVTNNVLFKTKRYKVWMVWSGPQSAEDSSVDTEDEVEEDDL